MPDTPGTPFTTTDREAAYQHFAPLVAAIPEADLDPWHYDAEIVRVNTTRSLAALEPHLAAQAPNLPSVDMNEIRELPALGLALAFADARVFTPASPMEIKAYQARQRPKRRLAITMLGILKEMKMLADPAKLDAIIPGRGPIDEAQDGVAAVAVFRDNAATVANKHPFDDEWLASLAGDSNWLLAQLKPTGAKLDKAGKSPEALVRDRLYAEIARRHGQAKKVAVEVWGWKLVDERFPALHAREIAKGTPEGDPEPPTS